MSVFEYDQSKAGNAGETRGMSHNSGRSHGFENVKNSIADQLETIAEMLDEKSTGQDAQSGTAQYGKQASKFLEKSAGYVREFDYEHAEARVRECIKQHPGRSLLVAGAVGLIIGAVLRRR
ncbi:DUF883 C-terminal domain-containing protein [Desulfonatronum lacustre]|uniref:DUF883 C-terminal domain-containing protein n=1 Tax=Desulfonatronum lacustre TaxID=66849 RepID=UPI001B7FB126|nr:DUF883 C-terminal domain-containing protein [Desulfonatronum lacustre]SMP73578.1 hypothetical protein SAMN06295888_12111 [Desulfonatronum zhilinae]